ncbi:exodeoxyribonuclease V subunit alpha [Kineococcus sp. TRM81007]|uniref:exodeoxyribonuclease V subunit alpha n=1 Tax=Kineococcus sp. TRM81007 TaxID=2925831 RepID=UPI001F56FCBC|nr:exodeoxyribonuclease V subunit alpha [Kineococcus sp. TRM81007]MCI2238502.1 exodeoxyribonuclease V subunit alpha [Kineococcus sp. TRM81007]
MSAPTTGTPTTTPTTAGAAPGEVPAAERAATRVRSAGGLLREFNALGLLRAADVHVARRLGAVTGEDDERVLLAVALAVRAVRHGSVVLHLEQAPATVVPEDEEDTGAVGAVEAPWPEPAGWLRAVRASALTTVHEEAPAAAGAQGAAGAPGPPPRPVHVVGDGLWLDRYWRLELAVADDLRRRAAQVPAHDEQRVREVLDRLWPGEDEPSDQRRAAEVCLRSGVAVLGGGPGTGKTTTVARLLAALHDLAGDGAPPRVALAAPTGKAAARLTEAVTAAASTPGVFSERQAAFLAAASASTLHRLLGLRPGSTRARYDAEHRLPHDVVVVDEASMVGLGVVAHLLAALRPQARLVLVGDPDQLASVEVGAVLADLVAPALAPTGGGDEVGGGRPGTVAGGVALLRTTHRFSSGGPIAELARAVRAGDAGAVVDVLRAGGDGLEFVEVAEDEPVAGAALEAVRADVVARGRDVVRAAVGGDVPAALLALDAHRVLCAHRHGGRGVSRFSALAHRWAVEELGVRPRPDGRYVGLPVIVTTNDAAAGVFNGDTGVVLESGGDLVVAVGRGDGPLLVPLARLAAVEPVHAMTVHRSQGSQFGAVTVLAAPARSPLATREMLYTAVTRARHRVRVVGSVEAVTAAVQRPLARATGLAARLAP